MKKFHIIAMCLLTLTILACKDNKQETKDKIPDKEEPEHPWPGEGESDIRPEKTEITFGAKGDTVIVNTENGYWTLILHDDGGQWLEPTNYTKDTLTDTWTKLIALESEKHINNANNTDFWITSKKVKVIVFDNNTGLDRTRDMLLGKENSGAIINITQTAK